MRPYDGIGWDISSYFVHLKSDSNMNHSFHNLDNNGDQIYNPDWNFGSGRAIKGISRGLFDPSAAIPLKLRDQETKVWVPLVTTWTDNTIKGYAYCGWETSSGTKWGAIWRYDREETYTDFSTATKTFQAPQSGGISKVTNRYQFTITTGSATLGLKSATDINGGTPSEGKIPFDIPDVDENPIILEFSN